MWFLVLLAVLRTWILGTSLSRNNAPVPLNNTHFTVLSDSLFKNSLQNVHSEISGLLRETVFKVFEMCDFSILLVPPLKEIPFGPIA